jgi:DNA repair exonuclease SbcCD nuclease subunit
MPGLFKKAAVFTDLHFGLKNNSREHNDDCVQFIDWFIDQSKQQSAETCIFSGDFHHNRASINVSTLNYSVNAMKKLSAAFNHVYILVGNHDLYYRANRELNSFPYADLLPNVTIINDNILEIGDVGFVPWLVDEEWKKVKKLNSKYIFGHFELPHFMLNSIVKMPDHGELQVENFTKSDYVFSGHFHKRQIQDNVHYLGSPFAHNYADAWDSNRGCMFLEWDKVPQYVNYFGPRYITTTLSQLIDNSERYLDARTFCRASLDLPITYEEANFIRQTFIEQYNPRELSLVPLKKQEHEQDSFTIDDLSVESVDQIVTRRIAEIQSIKIDSNRITKIYKEL